MNQLLKYASAWLMLLAVGCQPSVSPPKPVIPIPSERQLAWQEMEFYGFIHFSINTFTNAEWGYGDKSPSLFNPIALDTRQWAKVAKEAGMKGIILTAKHHDGFCMWPSKYTEHSVKNSPWRDGKGDLVKELADACREYGLKLGIYLSPWDRNHPDYGKPEYVTYFRNQLTELLTNYGDVFEVWFDGANGGDGYYGGANESRRVDKRSYYDWPTTVELIRKLQPNAVIFSDAGPDVRWVGNEHGHAYPTTWSPLLRDEVYGGMPEYAKEYSMGQENGTHWVPAEADVSIRPGWFYHKNEDDKVRSLKTLLDIYYKSIGQNSSFLLNFPVDRRGLIHENDVKQLKKLTDQLKRDFATDLAKNKSVEATNERGGSDQYGAENLLDGNKESYWATDDDVIEASVTIDLGSPTAFNRFLVQEYIALGQRVKSFTVEAEIDGQWQMLDEQTTIGYKRILRLDDVVASKIRFTVKDAKACPVISNIEVYNAPVVVDEPKIVRNKEGQVTLNTPQEGVEVYFTLDGSDPDLKSSRYANALTIDKPTVVKALSYDPATQRQSEVATVQFDVSKKSWTVKSSDDNAVKAIDDNKATKWAVGGAKPAVQIDLGRVEAVKGFTYTPDQSRWTSGVITHYSFYISQNGKIWKRVAKGEFSNILNNPLEQKVELGSSFDARHIKLVAEKLMDGADKAVVAEIGIITK